MRRQRLSRYGVGYCCLAASIAFLVAPVLWLIITSFMTEQEALSIPPHLIPQQPTLRNYLAFFDPETYGGAAVSAARAVGSGLRNSLFVACSVAIINVVFGGLAGYAAARFEYRGSRLLMIAYIMTRMVPSVALIIPTFLIMKSFDLLNTPFGLILVDSGISLPFTVWVLRSYFKTLPRDLEEAARVDGCTWFGAMLRVVAPIAAPGLVTAGIFGFLTAWGDFAYAVVLTRSTESQTIPVVVAQFATGERVEKSIMTAAGVAAVMPPVLLALVFQRLLVQGLSSGATKG